MVREPVKSMAVLRDSVNISIKAMTPSTPPRAAAWTKGKAKPAMLAPKASDLAISTPVRIPPEANTGIVGLSRGSQYYGRVIAPIPEIVDRITGWVTLSLDCGPVGSATPGQVHGGHTAGGQLCDILRTKAEAGFFDDYRQVELTTEFFRCWLIFQ